LAHDISYIETLECRRQNYERMDVKKIPIVKVEVPMAQVSWSDARPMCEKLKDASDFALALEMRRRGYEIAGKILTQQHKFHTRKEHGTE
jgi:hypothetical protein